MSVASFSARHLNKLLAEIASQPTIGLGLLREIAAQLRTVEKQMDLPAKRVVASMLVMTVQSVCDRFDGDPMTADDSIRIADFVRGPVQDALRFLVADVANPNDRAIALMAQLAL